MYNNLFFNEKELETDNDYDKLKKKQSIVRNDFKTVGKYNIPLVRKQDMNFEEIEPWCYTKNNCK